MNISCAFTVTLMVFVFNVNSIAISQVIHHSKKQTRQGMPGLTGHPEADTPQAVMRWTPSHTQRLSEFVGEHDHGEVYSSSRPFRQIWKFYANKVGIDASHPVLLPQTGAFCYTLGGGNAVLWDIRKQMQSAVVIKQMKTQRVTVFISQAKNEPTTHIVLTFTTK